MQANPGQEMANARPSAGESSSSARQGAGNVKFEAERKMEEATAQPESQIKVKMTE